MAFAVLASLLPLVLCGCITDSSSGFPAEGFVTPAIAHAYLPLQGQAYLVLEGYGVGTVIAPGIAATNDHNSNLVHANQVIGHSSQYDLLFFRTEHGMVPPRGEPYIGEHVIAYGQGIHGELRMAKGRVRWTDAPVLPRCEDCVIQRAFAFEAEGGPGFSGGPVVDMKTGQLVGIVFGYRNGIDGHSPDQRLMYAYDMKRVFEELGAIRKPASLALH